MSSRPHPMRSWCRSRTARDGIDLITLSAVYYLVVLASAVLLLLRSRSLDAGARAVVAIVFAGIALNALVTGTISTPDHRFPGPGDMGPAGAGGDRSAAPADAAVGGGMRMRARAGWLGRQEPELLA